MPVIECDYLVVGSGAAPLAFIDTLLAERPSTKIVLVDRHPVPGGHWVDAYGHVRLHQPSVVYGVASRQLEGNWLWQTLIRRTLPWQPRAGKGELLRYFGSCVEGWQGEGRVRYFPGCEYDFGQTPVNGGDSGNGGDVHSFSSLDGRETYRVEVGVKLVNGVLGECHVPSKHPVLFPVDDGITVLTPNQLFEEHTQNITNGTGASRRILDYLSRSTPSAVTKHYVVLGAGKTAMDAVVYLQSEMNVPPDSISWVVPNDVWMIARDGGGSPWSLPEALVRHKGDHKAAFASLENKGVLVGLDPHHPPTRFRFPVVGTDELALLRRIDSVVRRGRVTAIAPAVEDSPRAVVEFGTDGGRWTSPVPARDCVFVHCTSPGPFGRLKKDDGVFVSPRRIDLFMVFYPPISISMSCLAYLEAARARGTLDVVFGRKLVVAEDGDCGATDEEVLRKLIKSMMFDAEKSDERAEYQTIVNQAVFLAVADADPMVGYQWMKGNRLSLLSKPGSKCRSYEMVSAMLVGGESFGFSEGRVRMLSLLKDKLELLKRM